MAAGEEPLSAQVILRDAGAADVVVEFLGSSGLETGPVVGTSFAVTGPRAAYEQTLGPEAAELAAAGEAAELSLTRLPESLAAAVETIAVQGPPDFGPTAH
jgi:hypothetical protein